MQQRTRLDPTVTFFRRFRSDTKEEDMITVHCRVPESLTYGSCKRSVALEMMIGGKESDQCFSID